MAIQISGTTVIDNSRNLQCIESVSGNGIATQAEAEAGTVNNQIMTPLRVSQAIAALGGGMVDDDINWSTCNVGCAVRGGGNVIRKTGGVIWIASPSYYSTMAPWGFGDNGGNGPSTSQFEACTGRSGWFVPDATKLTCALNCRAYWSSYCNNWYNSSQAATYCYCQAGFNSVSQKLPYSTFTCTRVYTLSTTSYPTIAIRVVCY